MSYPPLLSICKIMIKNFSLLMIYTKGRNPQFWGFSPGGERLSQGWRPPAVGRAVELFPSKRVEAPCGPKHFYRQRMRWWRRGVWGEEKLVLKPDARSLEWIWLLGVQGGCQ